MSWKLRGFKTLGIATALAAALFAQTARADLATDITNALGQPTLNAQVDAIKTISAAQANDTGNFQALVNLVANGITESNAGAFTGALASACGGVPDCSAQTSIIINTMVTRFPGAGGDILAACLANGCPQQVATAQFAQAISTAAGQSLSLIPVLPPVTPGTGANLLGQGNVKEEGLTVRLGFTGEGLPQTVETPQSPTQPTNLN